MAAGTTFVTGNTGLPQLSYSVAQDSVFVDVLNMSDLTPSETTYDEYEATHTDITTGLKKFIKGWGDAGEFTFEFVYTEATYVQLKAIEGTTVGWRLDVTDSTNSSTGSIYDWIGYIKSVVETKPTQDTYRVSITIRVDETGVVHTLST